MNGRRVSAIGRARTRGMVLFVALIAMVVLSLAVVGLIRSIDNATLLGGNMAQRQSALQVSDIGIEAARAFLVANAANTALLYNHQTPTSAEPYASVAPTNWDYRTHNWATQAQTLADARATTGNDVQYVIHRLCTFSDKGFPVGNPLDPDNRCSLTTAALASNAPTQGVSYGEANFGQSITGRPVYRVTVRVVGQRNSQTFVQATFK